jgi:hypothetical protein
MLYQEKSSESRALSNMIVFLFGVMIMLRNVAQGFKWGSIGLSGRKFRSSLRSSPDAGVTLPKVIETSNVPVYVFSSQPVEEEAMEQLKNLANSDIPVGYVAAMPGNILSLFPFSPFHSM